MPEARRDVHLDPFVNVGQGLFARVRDYPTTLECGRPSHKPALWPRFQLHIDEIGGRGDVPPLSSLDQRRVIVDEVSEAHLAEDAAESAGGASDEHNAG